ncbi:ArsB/NhaD family transporter [Rhodococcus sp. G-MC3]|uniref:ArsB/NhaD family transporter n=1 Tax=Rhodococcus sp. G-MC3 TaxID=3046209 RepID=UPI0024B9713F|nr:ArsB/NhaD family transporter [Rhodococcus sp. G-MC3]MDJ0393007.1 ArsB/NhaD family transporter [Rhodococcus sp. G-MC3]
MTLVAAALVAAVLIFAIVRPRGLPEIVAALPAAGLALVLGLVTIADAWEQVLELLPTVVFLAFILILAHLAGALGVFEWIASVMSRTAKGNPHRLLTSVFVAAAITTAVLSLDATVVLLTPAVIGAARSLRMSARPHSYASAHLSNSASTLLPVSNLTNLLAFTATGLTFVHFAALMALPWLVTILIEFAVFWFFFRKDLRDTEEVPAPEPVGAPTVALSVLGATLLGFAVAGFFHVEPFWVAAVGSIALAVPALKDGYTVPTRLLRAADLKFCGFVLLLGVVVEGVTSGPIGEWLSGILPTTPSFLGLLATAAIAAVAANVVNNLPATLMLLAAFGPSAPLGLLLAMVIGVNLGPNLTYVGSLAIMLWRRVGADNEEPAALGTFTVLGVITTPLTIVGAVAALWVSLRL